MAFVDVPMLMMCPPVRAAHHTSQVQILASVPGSPGVPDPPLARGQPPPHRCPHDRSISAWYSHPPIMHQALPRCRRCRPPLPRPYLFRTSAFPLQLLGPSLNSSPLRPPRWCLWSTIGVTPAPPTPPGPPSQPSAAVAAVPFLCRGGYLVDPPVVTCKPLGRVMHMRDACAAYRL